MIFNVHTHLNDESEFYRSEELIQECLNNNVNKLVVIGFDVNSSKRALELSERYESVYAAIGIHPSEVNKENNTIEELEKLINNKKVIAIGEIGLDYHYEDNPSKEVQKEWFIKQIKLAHKYKLPIIIHSRDAMKDTIDVLKSNKEYYEKGIMHCYSGSIESANELMKLGFYFSFAGTLTFKNAKNLKDVAINLPIDRILIETDDPYLTPTPFRGKENHPSYVVYVLEELAKIKNLSKEEVEKITYENALGVFNNVND